MCFYRFEAEIGFEEYNGKMIFRMILTKVMDDQDFQSHEKCEAWLDENGQKVEAYTKELSK